MVGAANPTETFAALSADPGAHLVDVRTRPEWQFVGGPDLSAIGKRVWPIEWKTYPSMAANETFAATLQRQLESVPASSLYFICRSGARSLDAAVAMSALPTFQNLRLFNVVEGFEGDLNDDGKRGLSSGWKARNLPWRQS